MEKSINVVRYETRKAAINELIYIFHSHTEIDTVNLDLR